MAFIWRAVKQENYKSLTRQIRYKFGRCSLVFVPIFVQNENCWWDSDCIFFKIKIETNLKIHFLNWHQSFELVSQLKGLYLQKTLFEEYWVLYSSQGHTIERLRKHICLTSHELVQRNTTELLLSAYRSLHS